MNHLCTILSLGLSLTVSAVAARPAWVEAEPAAGAASIAAIAEGAAQDLVVLEGGLAQGLQRGMVLLATESDRPVGRLLVAEATEDRAVALILELVPGQLLEPGDVARRSLIRL